MRKPRVLRPQEEVIAWLESTHPKVDFTTDRAWVWVTGLDGDTLAPAHRGKCECATCKQRSEVRKSLAEYGFRYAANGHECPDGEIAHWGNSCTAPLPFRRRRSKGKTSEQRDADQPKATEDVAAKLAALLAA